MGNRVCGVCWVYKNSLTWLDSARLDVSPRSIRDRSYPGWIERGKRLFVIGDTCKAKFANGTKGTLKGTYEDKSAVRGEEN